ncbi:MAG: hypothetical protein LBU51_00555 [Bacteroidales bacterium]|nr:hypothetical protein [Bacteroidales bacterium]
MAVYLAYGNVLPDRKEKIMTSSYGETSGFTALGANELVLVNGGKGSSNGGSSSSKGKITKTSGGMENPVGPYETSPGAQRGNGDEKNNGSKH